MLNSAKRRKIMHCLLSGYGRRVHRCARALRVNDCGYGRRVYGCVDVSFLFNNKIPKTDCSSGLKT